MTSSSDPTADARARGRAPALVLCLLLVPAVAAAQLTRVSVAHDGSEANGPSDEATVTPSGRHVAFKSEAMNLVPGDTNGAADIFLRDLLAGTTTRVSVAGDGLERPGESSAPDLTPDARYVVFASRAALAADDTRTCPGRFPGIPVNCSDIYLRDRQNGTTVRLSNGVGGEEANGDSARPRISADGRFVAFESTASNLVTDDTNGVSDIFVLDRQTGTIRCVSRRQAGEPADGGSFLVSMSDDGQVLAFISAAASLHDTPDASYTPANGCTPALCPRAFVVDRDGRVSRVPWYRRAPPEVTAVLPVMAIGVSVSTDGGSVAAMVQSGPIGPGKPPFSFSWVHDLSAGRSRWSTLGGSGLAWDGRTLAYGLWTTGLEPNGPRVEDTIAGLVDTGPILPGTNVLDLASEGSATGAPSVLLSLRSPGILEDTNNASDIYLLDRDSDDDGMSTAWETLFGLLPANGSDAGEDPDGDGLTNLAEFLAASHPRGTVRRYLAEGATNAFFTTRLALFNPGELVATAVVRLAGQDGRTTSISQALLPRSPSQLPLNGLADSFAILIESDRPVVADRTMTWDRDGYGSHSETAVDAPATTWFLAEGATHGSFALFYLLQNPGPLPAQVAITYLRPAPAAPIVKVYDLLPASRRTIPVEGEDSGLVDVDVSARLDSTVPIVVERAMYADTPGQIFGAGHAGTGVTATAARWFLAEGATGDFFDLYYLIANPSPQDVTVRVTYALPAGPPLVREYVVARESRRTISVRYEDPRLDNTPVSATLESLDGTGIVVERSMWWPGLGHWQEGHLVAGSTTTARRWALAEGYTFTAGLPGTTNTETYLLIANPTPTHGTATLTAYTGGPTYTRTVPLPPNSRVTVAMSGVVPVPVPFAVIVESDGPEIVVERAMYSDANGIVWAAGAAALGTPLPQ